MRSILSSAAVALALVAVAAPAAAQQAPPASEVEWKGDLPRHFEGIALTPDQKRQVVEIQKKFHARMDALRDSAKAAGAAADSPEVKQRLGGVMFEEHEAFKAILDEAGRRRFDENMAKMHGASHGGGHGAGHGAGHGSGHAGGHGAGHGGGRPPAR